MGLEAVSKKDLTRPDQEDPAPPIEDVGRRYLGGTMDAMIVFNDPATQCQRSFKINRYVYSTDTPEEVNRMADETQAALERQFMRHDLKRMEREREQQIINMKQYRDNLKELATRRANRPHGKGLNQSELTQLDNGDATMAKAEVLLKDIEDKIAATKLACGLA